MLVKHAELKNSELLRAFLTSSEFLEDEEDYDEEDNSFGKTFRKSIVPLSRRDRGHNLDAFVKSLILSCSASLVPVFVLFFARTLFRIGAT